METTITEPMEKNNVTPNKKPTEIKLESNEVPKQPDNRAQRLNRMAEMKRIYEFFRNITNQKRAQEENFLPFPQELKAPSLETDYREFIEYYLAALSLGMDKSKGPPFLNDRELGFLKERIAEFISFTGYGSEQRLKRRNHGKESEGFSLYGTNDEEGLHGGNADVYDGEEQDDYDINELEDGDNFLYDYGPHHIEVEVNNGPAGSQPVDPNEPSCEFTFEYDRNGTLIPTDNNIEEKLRLMCLQTAEEAGFTGGKKKKSGRKKKKKTQNAGAVNEVDESCCLFCQYEAFFGVKPVHMMKWYDRKIEKEERRRQRIKEKLENAKLKALQRQREHRHESDDDSH